MAAIVPHRRGHRVDGLSTAGLRNFTVVTSLGPMVFSAESATPRVLMIHGFKRQAGQLVSWRDRIPGLGLMHLPGHSRAPELSELSLAAWIEGLRQLVAVAFPEPPLIIAESLGSIVAMNLPARALIAVEPLLSTDNLWPLRRTIRNARAKGVEIRAEEEALFDAPFHWVLDKIATPTLVLAGDVPLLPERNVRPEPSLLTDADFAAYAAHPLVEAHRITGGHTLLDHNPEGVMAAAAPFMRRHGFLDPAR